MTAMFTLKGCDKQANRQISHKYSIDTCKMDCGSFHFWFNVNPFIFNGHTDGRMVRVEYEIISTEF